MTHLEYLESVSFHNHKLKNVLRTLWEIFTERIDAETNGNIKRVLLQQRVAAVQMLSTVFKDDSDAVLEFLYMKKPKSRQDSGVNLYTFGKTGMIKTKEGFLPHESDAAAIAKTDKFNEDCPHCPNEFEQSDDTKHIETHRPLPVTSFKVEKEEVAQPKTVATPLAVVEEPVTTSTPKTGDSTSTPEELNDIQTELLTDRDNMIFKIANATTAHEILSYFGYEQGKNDIEVRSMMRSFMGQMGVSIPANVTRPQTLAEKWLAWKEAEEAKGKSILNQ